MHDSGSELPPRHGVDDENDLSRFEPLDGTPMAPSWQPVRTRWVTNHGTRPIPDFSTLSGAPVFNAWAL